MKKLLYIAFIAPFISQAIHACDVCAAQMEIGDTFGSTALSPIGRERGTYSSAVARANPAYSSNPTIAPDQPTRINRIICRWSNSTCLSRRWVRPSHQS